MTVDCDTIVGRSFPKDLLKICLKLKCLEAFREIFRNKVYEKIVQKIISEFSDKITINAYLYATLSVFDTNAVQFLSVSLVGSFAEYYPNLFDKSDSEALEHKKKRNCYEVLLPFMNF